MVRTWALRGQTPLLRHTLTRDHLSVISAVAPDGRLFLRMQEQAYDSAGVIAFLGELRAQIARPPRASIWLPGYAPQLNPYEGV